MKKTLLFFSLLLLFACKRDKPVEPAVSSPGGIQPGAGVFIVNEGNYGWGNAEISYYRFSDKQVFQDLFSAENSRPLGDVAQNMKIINGKGFIVLNNSNKIEIVNLSDFSSSGTINGFTSPRYCVQSSAQKIYVSDLYANAVSVVDLSSLSISGQIPFTGWSEEMVLVNDKIFIGNNLSAKILVVDAANDTILDTIPVGNYCNSLVVDNQGMIWALCSGMSGQSAVLHQLDPVDDSIVQSIVFPGNQTPWRLKINGGGDRLYYLDNGVYSLEVSSAVLPVNPLIPAGSSLFYSLGIDPVSGDIYVGDAVDYVQNGVIYRYSGNGNLIDQFAGGVIPGEFVFY